MDWMACDGTGPWATNTSFLSSGTVVERAGPHPDETRNGAGSLSEPL